jgi:hypothetical protein
MKNLLNTVTVLFVFIAFSAGALAAPSSITLTYDLKRNGKLFANVTEHFKQDGKTYAIESVTKGKGIYALLGDRILKSNGLVTKQGLKPLHFESLQSKKTDKAIINDFDWEKSVVNMQIKGEQKTEDLQKGTQDLLSVMYQFMFVKPKVSNLKVPVSIGKRITQKSFEVDSNNQITTDMGEFKALRLSSKNDEDTKTIYLAKDKQYIPVKMELLEDGAKIEQTITKITIE